MKMNNVLELLLYWPFVTSTALFFIGLLASACWIKRNGQNRKWAGWVYVFGKVTFWASMTCSLINYFFPNMFWFFEFLIWTTITYSQVPNTLKQLGIVGRNQAFMIQNTLLGRKENEIPIYRIAGPGWNWLVFGDTVAYDLFIDKDVSVSKTVTIETSNAPMVVDITYTSRPDPKHLQENVEVSGGNQSKREKILKDVFNAHVISRVSDVLKKKSRDELLSDKAGLTREINEGTRFAEDIEEKYGEQIGTIIIGNVDDTEEIKNSYEQGEVLRLQTKNALEMFKALYGRDPRDTEEDQKKMEQCIEHVQVSDDEIDKLVLDIKGLEGVEDSDKALIISGLGQIRKHKAAEVS